MADEGSTGVGGSVVPVGSCSVREMKVTNDRKEREGHDRKREQQSHTRRSVDEMIGELNNAVHVMKKRIAFSIGTEGGVRVLEIIDMDSDSVIRKLPLDEVMRMERMEVLHGMLVDKNG